MLTDEMLYMLIPQIEKMLLTQLDTEMTAVPAHKFSWHFRIKMWFLIRCANKRTSPMPEFNLRKALIVAVTALIITATTVFAITFLHNSTTERSNLHTKYEFTNSVGEVIDIKWELSYLPKGYKLNSAQDIDGEILQTYANDSGETIYFSAFKATTETDIYIDNEHSVYSRIEINGVPADLYIAADDMERNHLILVKDDYTLHFMGNLHKNQLIKIAKHTKFKE